MAKKSSLLNILIVGLVILGIWYFLGVSECQSGDEKCEGTTYFLCVDDGWVNQGEVPGFCGVEEDPDCEYYFRFSNNTCMVVCLLPEEVTENDYETLEECEENIVEEPDLVWFRTSDLTYPRDHPYSNISLSENCGDDLLVIGYEGGGHPSPQTCPPGDFEILLDNIPGDLSDGTSNSPLRLYYIGEIGGGERWGVCQSDEVGGIFFREYGYSIHHGILGYESPESIDPEREVAC